MPISLYCNEHCRINNRVALILFTCLDSIYSDPGVQFNTVHVQLSNSAVVYSVHDRRYGFVLVFILDVLHEHVQNEIREKITVKLKYTYGIVLNLIFLFFFFHINVKITIPYRNIINFI